VRRPARRSSAKPVDSIFVLFVEKTVRVIKYGEINLVTELPWEPE
jgi:hypothetical protein